MLIQNPILTGFNPDPSICVVGDDFYIATSTFEWFPGVQIHHSKDLKHWRLLARPLRRVSQLDLRGCQHSAGIWAPCLSYADGLFHLVVANVRSHGGPTTDSPVYLFTASEIDGEWSDGIKLGANGFDPSIFHDDDGKKYLVNMEMGGTDNPERFNGITLQEYCPQKAKLIGPRKMIWKGTELGITEGPHIYKKDGWYYLLTAEGGTSVAHAVSMARSRDLWGPYQVAPANPMLTSANQPELALQATGHGDLFQTPNGDWYTVHLCKRFFEPAKTEGSGSNIAILGRETALQKVIWAEGEFPRLAEGGNRPHETLEVTGLTEQPWPTENLRDDFTGPELNPHFQFLREPAQEDWLSLNRNPGQLSLKGRHSLFSPFEQSLVARRLQHFQAEAETCLHFDPEHPKQTAGLIAYYDGRNYIYFQVSADAPGQRRLGILRSDNGTGWGNTPHYLPVTELPAQEPVYLRMRNDYEHLSFEWSLDGTKWQVVDRIYDSINMGDGASEISGFTGTFWGLCCQDTTGEERWAEFDYFDYRPQS